MSSGEGGGPTAAEVGAEHKVDNGFSREVAGKKLAVKETAVRKKLQDNKSLQPADLPKGEKAVYARSALSRGLKTGNPDFDYGTDGAEVKFFNPDEANETITIEPGGTEPSFNISVITGEETGPDGSIVYVCKTPGGEEKRVPVDMMADSYTKQNADALGEAFLPDPDQAALVSWYSVDDGSDCPVDVDTVSAIDAADIEEPEIALVEVDAFISQQVDALRNEIAFLQEHSTGDAQEINRLDQLQSVLGECQRAALMEGPGGIFYKQRLLTRLRPLQITQGEQGRATAEVIDGHLESITNSGALDNAEVELVQLIHDELPDEKADRYDALMKKVFDEHKGMDVLQDADVEKLAGLNKLIFGSEAMTNKVVDALLGNPDVDEATRKSSKH